MVVFRSEPQTAATGSTTPYTLDFLLTLPKLYSLPISRRTALYILLGLAAIPFTRVLSTPTPTPTPKSKTASTPKSTSDSGIINWGINATGVGDSVNDRLFANCFRTFRFRSPENAFDDKVSIPSDENGYPTADFGCFFWDGAFLKNVNGTYFLSFKGQATILPDGFEISEIKYDATLNKTTAKAYMKPDGAGVMRFKDTKRTPNSPANSGLTELKLMRPKVYGGTESYAESTTFTDPVKKLLQLFSHVRYMDMTRTNGKLSEKSWSDRVLPSYLNQQSEKGVAWEYLIQLSNEIERSAYICIPVNADDEYIRQLALLFKNGSTINGVTYSGLKPSLKIYIEYANELWNTAPGFPQGEEVRKKAIAELQSTAGNSILNYDKSWDGKPEGNWNFIYRYAGRRIVQISDIWKSVFGDDEYSKRIYPLYMWQQGNANGTGDIGLDMIAVLADQRKVPINTLVRGGGGSHYYNPDNASDSLTIDNIWTSDSFDGEKWTKNLEIDLSKVAANGIQYISYEGGPSMDTTSHSDEVKKQAWSDPRMKTLFIQHHKIIEQYGGIVTYFYAGGVGEGYYQWGFTQDPTNLDTPKLQAIKELNQRTNREEVTAGTLVPATFKAASYAFFTDYDQHDKNASVVQYIRKGWSQTYLLRSTSERTYKMKISYDGNTLPKVKVIVNGKVLGEFTFTATSDWGKAVESTEMSVPLVAGVNGVKLILVSGDTNFYNISLS